jgi:hypothetical protein
VSQGKLPEAVQCTFMRTGPRVARNVVAWRTQCRNRTTDPSRRCPQHRRPEAQR